MFVDNFKYTYLIVSKAKPSVYVNSELEFDLKLGTLSCIDNWDDIKISVKKSIYFEIYFRISFVLISIFLQYWISLNYDFINMILFSI
jgi:hypothetical protein